MSDTPRSALSARPDKSAHIVALLGGALALLGAVLPIVQAGSFSISLVDLGGASVLLYALPVVLVAVAVLALNGWLTAPRWWYLAVAGAGLLLAVLAVLAAAEQLGGVASLLARRRVGLAESLSTTAAGGYCLLLGYGGSVVAGFKVKNPERRGGA